MTSETFKAKVKRNVAANFDQSVAIYQAFEHEYGLFYDLAVELARFAGVSRGASVLDIGCGYGISSAALNNVFDCTVMGVDLSPHMVAAGQAACGSDAIALVVGDGENLAGVTNGRRFDFALYNASIFIFPDVAKAVREARACLAAGGKIAFSFYPDIVDADGRDLVPAAFERSGLPMPPHRVVTEYGAASEALRQQCGTIAQGQWLVPVDIPMVNAFFSIPAQSASLFPGMAFDRRRGMVNRLFAALGDGDHDLHMRWRMAAGRP